jgi:hypothetical protein
MMPAISAYGARQFLMIGLCAGAVFCALCIAKLVA